MVSGFMHLQARPAAVTAALLAEGLELEEVGGEVQVRNSCLHWAGSEGRRQVRRQRGCSACLNATGDASTVCFSTTRPESLNSNLAFPLLFAPQVVHTSARTGLGLGELAEALALQVRMCVLKGYLQLHRGAVPLAPCAPFSHPMIGGAHGAADRTTAHAPACHMPC